MSGGRLAGVLACWLLGWPVTPLGNSALGGLRRLDPPLALVLLSAAGVPPLPLWHPPWAPRVVVGRAVRMARLCRLLCAPPHRFGHLARVPAWAGLQCGVPVLACWHSPPPRQAVLPVSRPRDAGPLSGASGLALSPAGRQLGRWRAPGPGPGPGWGPGDCLMVLLWAVLPVRLVGRGVDGVPVRPVPSRRMVPWGRRAS